MRELFPDPKNKKKQWKPKIGRFLLDTDARFDNFLFQTGRWAREVWERFSMFMDRFHVGGWRRWMFVEPLSEGATMAAGGFVLLLALALPAFRETADDDWLKKSELAVTFLDRYGNEIGSRGIKHNDSIPLSEFPDSLIKATLATEDRRFYEHFGIDLPGTARALSPTPRPAASARAAPRSPSSSPRTCSSPTSAPSSARSRKRSWRCGWNRA